MRIQSLTPPVLTLLGVAGCLVLLFGLLATPSIAEKKGDRVYSFNDKGELIQPHGYRADGKPTCLDHQPSWMGLLQPKHQRIRKGVPFHVAFYLLFPEHRIPQRINPLG